MKTISLQPIGHVSSTRARHADDDWDRERGAITLDANQFSAEALLGLDQYTHVEVLFFMDQVEGATIERGARHPRGRSDWPKVGIFAQHARNRPNQLGTTICRILKVDGLCVEVEGLDALEGTPVLDLKPWVTEFGPRGATHQPAWVTELMRDYWVRK